MRLFSGKVTPLSDELVKALVADKDIETDAPRDVVKDFEAVFNSYLSAERDVNEQAREMSQNRPAEYGRLRRMLAQQRGIQVGEEMLDYLLDQLIEMLMHSANVEEVFAEDHLLRRRMRTVLKKYLEIDEALDTEVRGKIKHVQEGSRTWEVEYQRVMGDIQRRKGLS